MNREPLANGGGLVLGGFAGLVIGIALSLGGLAVADASHSCARGLAVGLLEIGVAVLFGWAAFCCMRRDVREFEDSFLLGLTLVAGAFVLLPWPCSLTFMGGALLIGSCGHA